jgi:hypothetical protein
MTGPTGGDGMTGPTGGDGVGPTGPLGAAGISVSGSGSTTPTTICQKQTAFLEEDPAMTGLKQTVFLEEEVLPSVVVEERERQRERTAGRVRGEHASKCKKIKNTNLQIYKFLLFCFITIYIDYFCIKK